MGDGTSAYAGITGVFGSGNVATVTMAAAAIAFADVTHDDLVAFKYAVPDWVRRLPDCAYFMSSGIAGVLEGLKDGIGRPLYQMPTADRAALAGVQASLVVTTRSEGGGTDRTFTAKNTTFRGVRGSVPALQDRGVGLFRCSLRCEPGASDTPATMVTNA